MQKYERVVRQTLVKYYKHLCICKKNIQCFIYPCNKKGCFIPNLRRIKKNDPWVLGRHNLVSELRYTNT